ncbi:3'(2'),5'-bisphosphate nucleotidase CysQ [Devosia sp.]|uniref:3'(2'),5'-bisphosphate nucleotidase CysQ n=1 Tax=Devosia sp. TaxID=1871048 RepID=UPI0025C2CDE6|nr:3'(2'),5'-bisphosphate nucleotidase CysQ [Devosia sp.]
MTTGTATTAAEDRELLRSAAVNAGIIAAGYFRTEFRTWTKENASPVSEADLVLDQFLGNTLLGARPDYGWLSEERADNAQRLTHRRVFIVDPIDGTRGFIRGEDSWTVTLAVVEDGIPIAGVVYAPARDEMYDAALGHGARFNGRPLVRQRHPGRTAPLIPAPGAVHQELQAGGLEYARGPAYPSLAYRLVQVATGHLDAAVTRRGAQDWDIAGAACILREAGVGFEDVCIGALRFNRPEIRHGALAAFGEPSLKAPLHAALVKVYGCPQPQEVDLERR